MSPTLSSGPHGCFGVRSTWDGPSHLAEVPLPSLSLPALGLPARAVEQESWAAAESLTEALINLGEESMGQVASRVLYKLIVGFHGRKIWTKQFMVGAGEPHVSPCLFLEGDKGKKKREPAYGCVSQWPYLEVAVHAHPNPA